MTNVQSEFRPLPCLMAPFAAFEYIADTKETRAWRQILRLRALAREKHGGELYLVGGAVVDLMTGVAPEDFDLLFVGLDSRFQAFLSDVRLVAPEFQYVEETYFGGTRWKDSDPKGDRILAGSTMFDILTDTSLEGYLDSVALNSDRVWYNWSTKSPEVDMSLFTGRIEQQGTRSQDKTLDAYMTARIGKARARHERIKNILSEAEFQAAQTGTLRAQVVSAVLPEMYPKIREWCAAAGKALP